MLNILLHLHSDFTLSLQFEEKQLLSLGSSVFLHHEVTPLLGLNTLHRWNTGLILKQSEVCPHVHFCYILSHRGNLLALNLLFFDLLEFLEQLRRNQVNFSGRFLSLCHHHFLLLFLILMLLLQVLEMKHVIKIVVSWASRRRHRSGELSYLKMDARITKVLVR